MYETGTYTTTTVPAEEPLTVAEVKTYLKVDSSTDDTLISVLIQAARESVEKYCRIAVIEQGITEYYPRFLPYGLRLSVSPLVSVEEVTYIDAGGTEQTLLPAIYGVYLEVKPPIVFLTYGQTFPTTRPQPNAVKVEYTAGYADAASVPAAIRQAMYLMIADWYDNRSDSVRTMPTASQILLNQYRVNYY